MQTPTQPSSTDEHEIRLGTGMGPLKFGASQDEVRSLMGEPEEIEESEDDDEFEHRPGTTSTKATRSTSTAKTITA
ncbi:hypothetical protein [Hymenobacter lapidiphilus]|uniref:hypothetical protein n=1 Tax=Hymenobacter sp. CCM 8763 TaxID=2303334 RepID=UPI001F5BE73C|nr:hypothetical protein [Hymenobacter sp. CCM 8763]